MSVAGVPSLPARPIDGHKGTFGTVLVIGGRADEHARMIGAPVLTARAALRAGCGLARLAMSATILDTALGMLASATGVPLPADRERAADAARVAMRDADVTALGPGLGPIAAMFVERVIHEEGSPIVLDADALNALARVGVGPIGRPAIVTPHPGEFRRLAESVGIGLSPTIAGERPKAAQALADATDSVVVLKGAQTIVADATRHWTCDAADAALATGGTGDVLTGAIAGLWASTSLDAFDVATLSVWAHARAAAIWRETHGASAGLLAHELADLLPRALEERRG